MEDNSEKILEMMKKQEVKTLNSLEALQAGLAHLQKKILFYTLVREAVKNKTPMASLNRFSSDFLIGIKPPSK